MSVRVEWCSAEAFSAEYSEPGDVAPDGQVAERGALLVGGDNPLAIEGSPQEVLRALGRAVMGAQA